MHEARFVVQWAVEIAVIVYLLTVACHTMTINCHSSGAQSTAQGKHAVLSQSEHSMLLFDSKFQVYQILKILQVTRYQPFDNTPTSSLKSLLCIIYWYLLSWRLCYVKD